MAVPILVHYDRYADLTFGFESVLESGAIGVNGVALVTEWLSGSLWSASCVTDPDTSWSVCGSDPDTIWTAVISDPDTVWSEC